MRLRDRAAAGGLAALGAGMGLTSMYYLDPASGAPRRARARQRVAATIGRGGRAAMVAGADLANRARGRLATARGRVIPDAAGDDVIVARVRSALGHLVSHPHALRVEALHGRVTVRGAVLAREADALATGVRRVRGVRDLELQLETHRSAEGIPALQGGEPPRAAPLARTPAGRLAVGAAWSALALLALRRRTSRVALGAIAALALAARGTRRPPPPA